MAFKLFIIRRVGPLFWLLGGTGMRTFFWFTSLTITHSIASAAGFLWRYNNGSSAFDGHQVSQYSILLADALFAISWFPFGHLLMAEASTELLPGLWGWLPVLINSMFWGAVVTACIWFKQRRQPHRSGAA